MLRRIANRIFCVVFAGGHFETLVFEPHRIAIRCICCGKETPGWRDIGIETVPRTTIDTLKHRTADEISRRSIAFGSETMERIGQTVLNADTRRTAAAR